MKKLNKRSVFSAVLAVMLVFSVGFYTCLEPTTAWFTDKGTQQQQFEMDEVDISYPEGVDDTVRLNFTAATKFADANERENMFEYAVQFYTFTATNNGDIDAYISFDALDVNYTDNTHYTVLDTRSYAAKGLRYFFYTYGNYGNGAEESSTFAAQDTDEFISGVFVNSSDKRVIYDGTNYFITNPTFTAALENKIKSYGAAYNNLATTADQTGFLNRCNSERILLNSGESVNICVAFWVEYDIMFDDRNYANFDIQFKVITEQAEHNTTVAP